MASLSKDGSGWRILFVCPATGKRHTVRTGRCAAKNAQTARHMLEKLVEAKRLGTALDPQAAAWLASIDDKLRDRLARVGLIDGPPRQSLGDFLADFIDQRQKRGDVAGATIAAWRVVAGDLTSHFGCDRALHRITRRDAEAWIASLKADKGLAENTVRRRTGWARQFFAQAVRHKLIAENPFADFATTVRPNPDRQFFVDRQTVARVLEQLPTAEWRLLFLFARFLGLRVPSEIRPLRWTDVAWDTMTLAIHSPKTARHEGHDRRVCPIFPEVLPALQEAYDAAPEGAEWLFPRLRTLSVAALSDHLERAVLRAGLSMWRKAWVNLRASRATELADQYPGHVAAAWLGHSDAIANANYRQVTATHMARATTEPTGDTPWTAPPQELAQKTAQQPHVTGGKGLPPDPGEDTNTRHCEPLHAGTLAGGRHLRTIASARARDHAH